jgi:hypothetical protein
LSVPWDIAHGAHFDMKSVPNICTHASYLWTANLVHSTGSPRGVC